jgi:hypothetical protein
MNGVIKITLVGSIAVLLLDTVASFLALWLDTNYGWFSLASFMLYIIFGYLGARRSRWFVGAIVAMCMAVVESTIGWAISWQIGPGKATSDLSSVVIVVTIVFVVVIAEILGLIGGALSLLKKTDA